MARARKGGDKSAASPLKKAEEAFDKALARLEEEVHAAHEREAGLARRLAETEAKLRAERAEWERRIGALEAENAALRRREEVARMEIDRLIADLEERLAGAAVAQTEGE
ncbi:MAG: hypothetical protein D6757_09065 [Alphaproteobacteria bacterium]|nr:MAG: hypothetical protein D6757_09065 [Alphaproteobacteria bacterium]